MRSHMDVKYLSIYHGNSCLSIGSTWIVPMGSTCPCVWLGHFISKVILIRMSVCLHRWDFLWTWEGIWEVSSWKKASSVSEELAASILSIDQTSVLRMDAARCLETLRKYHSARRHVPYDCKAGDTLSRHVSSPHELWEACWHVRSRDVTLAFGMWEAI